MKKERLYEFLTSQTKELKKDKCVYSYSINVHYEKNQCPYYINNNNDIKNICEWLKNPLVEHYDCDDEWGRVHLDVYVKGYYKHYKKTITKQEKQFKKALKRFDIFVKQMQEKHKDDHLEETNELLNHARKVLIENKDTNVDLIFKYFEKALEKKLNEKENK